MPPLGHTVKNQGGVQNRKETSPNQCHFSLLHKAATKRALAGSTPANTIQTVFNETASVIQEGKGKQSGLFVLRSESGNIYVVSGGTVLKWETALRKALEIIANEPNLTLNGIAPSICLKLSVAGQSLTEADKAHIIDAVGAVGVRAVFCKA